VANTPLLLMAVRIGQDSLVNAVIKIVGPTVAFLSFLALCFHVGFKIGSNYKEEK
jgi:hypothetical protein